MSKYERIDTKQIINWNELETKYEDMQWKYIDGELENFPDESIERKRCRLVLDAYQILKPYEAEIKKDYALLDFYNSPFKGEDLFAFAAGRLCAVYHQDQRLIEDFFGKQQQKQEPDWKELKKYFKYEFLKKNVFGFDSLKTRLTEIVGKDYDCACVALCIYESPQRQHTGKNFVKWYEVFCKIIDCEPNELYKKPKEIRKQTRYEDTITDFKFLSH